MNYIDVHTHSKPVSGVIAIRNLMNPDNLELLLEDEGFFSIGLHPWHIHPDHWEEDIITIRKFIHHPKVIAIGEAGLDRLTDLPLSLQTDIFKAMVALSEESQKPLIIHAVRTHTEIAVLHSAIKPKQSWIIHGFNVRKSIADGLIHLGIHLSFGSALLNENSAASTVFKDIPNDLFFLESDDKEISMDILYKRAAELKNTSVESLKNQIFKRFNRIFPHA